MNNPHQAETISTTRQRITAHLTGIGEDGIASAEIIESTHRTLPLVTGAKNIAFILFSMPGGTNPVTSADVVKSMQTGWFGTGSQTVSTIFQANSYGSLSVREIHKPLDRYRCR